MIRDEALAEPWADQAGAHQPAGRAVLVSSVVRPTATSAASCAFVSELRVRQRPAVAGPAAVGTVGSDT